MIYKLTLAFVGIWVVLYTLLFNIYFFPFGMIILVMLDYMAEQKIDPKYRRHYQSEYENAAEDTMKKILYYGSMVLFALLLNYLFNILW